MKKRYIILIIILLAAIYMFGSINIYLGSNSMFFTTAFDYSDATWFCKDFDLYASNYVKTTANIEEKYITICDDKGNELLCLFPRGDRLTDIYKTCDKKEPIGTFQVKYKKRFGKIYKFEIISRDGKNIAQFGQKLSFKRS